MALPYSTLDIFLVESLVSELTQSSLTATGEIEENIGILEK